MAGFVGNLSGYGQCEEKTRWMISEWKNRQGTPRHGQSFGVTGFRIAKLPAEDCKMDYSELRSMDGRIVLLATDTTS